MRAPQRNGEWLTFRRAGCDEGIAGHEDIKELGSRIEEVRCMTCKVLVVDDSRLARMSIARLLDTLRPGWIRVEAANAAEAIERQSREASDVALLDFNMPGPDGLALAADLRARYPAMPIAIISANSQDEIVARATAIGAAFLPKPLTEQLLADFLTAAEPRLPSAAAK
jgi:CheY-like chemotaxis protein